MRASSWYGFLAPAGTPPEVTNRLVEHIARILVLPDVKEKFDAAFLDAMPQGSVEMARFLDEEVRPQEHEADEAGSLTSTGWPPLHPAG